MNEQKQNDTRYTIAKRDVTIEQFIVTGIFIVLMIVWACLLEDKRFLFVPLTFLTVSVITFVILLFRYLTEPKIAIQADGNGIYLYYRRQREIFIKYEDITEVRESGIRNIYGKIVITTDKNKYESIRTYELSDKLLQRIESILKCDDKAEFLKKIITDTL